MNARPFSIRRSVILVLMFSILTPLWAQRTAIHAGRLIDGKSDRVLNEVTVMVENGHIISVANGYTAPAKEDRYYDLKDHTLLPGLMDMHTHLSGEFSRNSFHEGFRMNPADYAFRMVGYAEKTLLAGFTTVRDLGDSHGLTVSLRNAIRQGQIVGPRVFTAGKALGTTGGHADPTNGFNHFFRGDPGPAEGVVNSPDDARKAVRQRYKNGADLIKITATGGVLSEAKSGHNPQFTEEELQAIVTTARDYGFAVAAHAHGAEGMKRAIRAGVASIEHGTYMDEEVIDLMKKHGTFFVPTMMAGEWVTEKARIDGFFPEMIRTKAAKIGPLMADTFSRASRAGVKIAFGTDSGVSTHGENAREFELMVKAGMPPMKAIQSATRSAAELLGMDDRLGTIEKGMAADLIAVIGDPLENISILKDVRFVMKEGRVYKSGGERTD